MSTDLGWRAAGNEPCTEHGTERGVSTGMHVPGMRFSDIPAQHLACCGPTGSQPSCNWWLCAYCRKTLRRIPSPPDTVDSGPVDA